MKLIHHLILFFVLGINVIALVAQASKTEDLLIPIKRSSVLPFKTQSQIHITESGIIKIREFNGSILATGVKEGFTHLRHKDKTYDVYVLDSQKIRTFEYFANSLKQMLGLKLEICDLKICVAGELLTFQDYKTLVTVALQNDLSWIMNARVSKKIQSQIQEQIASALKSQNLPVYPLFFNTRAMIHASQTDIESQNLLKTLSSYGVDLKKDSKAFESLPMVDLKVEIVEFKKTSFSKIGIDWPGSYKASILQNSKPELPPFDLTLHNLEQKGDAHVLASPRLSCRSGSEAHFLAGGEFPIRIMNYKTNDIQWKKHGILLKFHPLAHTSGLIRLSITAEVSLLDTSQTVDGVPGLLVNRVESHIDLKSRETLALSGLIKKIQGSSTQGLIALSQIPIIGLLFGSQDYRNDQSDLVIFVTPTLL